MIIPSKFNGYVDGVRRYNGGGGGISAMTGAMPGNWMNTSNTVDNGGTQGFSITPDVNIAGVNNNAIANTPPPVAPWGTTAQSKADYYTNQLNAGQTDAQIRAAVEGNTQFGGPQSDADWKYLQDLSQKNQIGNTQASKADYYNQQLGRGSNDQQIRDRVTNNQLLGQQSDVDWNALIQTAAMNNPTRRPLAGSGQFYQPVYQGQYENYNTGNQMGVSQYGQGIPAAQNPYMFGGQMMGGGYGQYGSNNPYNPFTNSFLNMPSNLNQGTMQDKTNFYGNAIRSGFNDQQLYNQASGLFGQQSPQDWAYLQQLAAPRPSMAPAPATPTNQPIYSRSSMRRPMRNYAEGGITALLDKE